MGSSFATLPRPSTDLAQLLALLDGVQLVQDLKNEFQTRRCDKTKHRRTHTHKIYLQDTGHTPSLSRAARKDN